MTSQPFFQPYKSVAGALLFAAVLGPVGLLYSSFWGGLFMISVTMIAATISQTIVPVVLLWIFSCVWGVGAVEKYNRKIMMNNVPQ
jgi:hypothetical protein